MRRGRQVTLALSGAAFAAMAGAMAATAHTNTSSSSTHSTPPTTGLVEPDDDTVPTYTPPFEATPPSDRFAPSVPDTRSSGS
jgi:hypothetical protein